MAARMGQLRSTPCINCGSSSVQQLDDQTLRTLFDLFFIDGTVPFGAGGKVPVLMGTPYKKMESVSFDPTLMSDYTLITDRLQIYAFNHAPALWTLGITDYEHCLDALDDNIECLEHLLSRCRTWTLAKGSIVYRIRLNPSNARDAASYDTPPFNIKPDFFRFDGDDLPVFYGALEIETCIHECRTTLEDWVALATFEATSDISLLDLIEGFDESSARNPYQSVGALFRGMMLQGKRQYPRCQLWARFVKSKGFGGIRYQSYFSQVKPQPCIDIALFGQPIADGRLLLRSLNRVKIEAVRYEYIFGPIDP